MKLSLIFVTIISCLTANSQIKRYHSDTLVNADTAILEFTPAYYNAIQYHHISGTNDLRVIVQEANPQNQWYDLEVYKPVASGKQMLKWSDFLYARKARLVIYSAGTQIWQVFVATKPY